MSALSSPHPQENKEQDSFDKLPDELVMQIFSHLSPEDIACRVSNVCLRWHSIAKDPVLWEKATLLYDEMLSLEFEETILFAPLIAGVHINMFRHISDATIKSMMLGCKSIKCLSFYPGAEVPVHVKLNVLNFYGENLGELNIFVDDSYLANSKTFCKILGEMRHLKILTFRGSVSSGLFDNGFFENSLWKLESLDISTLSIMFQENENILCGGVSINPWQNFILRILDHYAQNMKKLSLPEGVFDLSTVNKLEIKFICSKIVNLKICEIGLRVVKKLDHLKVLYVQGLSRRNLEHLRVSAGLQYKSIFDWVDNSVQFSNVKELTLENIIEDERRLTDHLLQACINLESLTISSGCHTSAQLSSYISKSPSLRKLSIHRMPCLKSKHLETIKCYLPNLLILNLKNNTLTDGILQFYVNNVQEKMPNLKLICDWGYWNINGGNPWSGQDKLCTMSISSRSVTECATSSDSLSHDRVKVAQMLDALTDYEDDD
ncbi:F-box/LRR-repeat protein 7 [Frankliniella fusca]|uniref:F-box/LRR-repeat protein 7 n=1 Tax=Frankliniella fusca TaxID=407009 RepID=A0AAE1L8D4_9NEOP|nr:F-box/LRR-repeat protein 7 [Frankliniella fusca]